MSKEFKDLVDQFEDAVWRYPQLKPRDKLVARVMLRHANSSHWRLTGELLTWIGVEATSEKTALSTRDVERARSALVQEGLLDVVEVARRGQTARLRFSRAWLQRADAEWADTGVADTGVGTSPDQPPESPPSAAKIVPIGPTQESPESLEGIRVNAPTRVSVHAGKGILVAQLAQHFSPAEIANWLAPCRIELDGGTVIVWTEGRFAADWIRRTEFSDRLKAALGAYDIEVRVGIPPVPPPAGPRLRPVMTEGRA